MGFEETVMTGLALDKGLFVPEQVPFLGADKIEQWRGLSFPELSYEIMSCYISPEEIPREDLKDLVYRSVVNFRTEEVTPLKQVNGMWVLELFHGPTFAFKDVALQFLGNLFEYFLMRKPGSRLTIMGATSGDTGSAAIYGLRGKKNVNCFILFPRGRVSPIQERQMTTVPDENIHCIAMEGTFDDCQAVVKASFNNNAFRNEVSIGAVNSINWARVLAQMSYFFYAYFRVTDTYPDIKEVSFSVPTGNYGDILAGYYAKKMGLPVGKLIVATNENDILHRFFTTGKYHRKNFIETIAPSMDICVSSNFERYLYHLCGDNGAMLNTWMTNFEKTGELTITGDLLEDAKREFSSGSVYKTENLDIIKQYWDKHQYLLCPHSSVGIGVVESASLISPAMVCLATAHPGKFPEAVGQALKNNVPRPPVQLAVLLKLPTRLTELPFNEQKVQEFVRATLGRKAVSANSHSAPPLPVLRSLAWIGVGILIGFAVSKHTARF